MRDKLTQWIEEGQRRRRLEVVEAENERLRAENARLAHLVATVMEAAEGVTAVITTPDGHERSISFLDAMRQGGVQIPVGPLEPLGPRGKDE